MTPRPQLNPDTLKYSDYMDTRGKVKRRLTTEADRQWFLAWKKRIEERYGITV
jgi:hypothetical protein